MIAFSRRHTLLCILTLALALRLLAAFALQNHLDSAGRSFLIEGDANGYWQLGRQMASGEAYEIYERRVLRMPGFPALLAALISIGGESLPAARCVLACVGTLACGLVFVLGKQLFGNTVGLWSAGFTAVSPVLIGFSVIILSETLFAACLVASLIGMAHTVRGLQENRSLLAIVVSAILAGILVALACYVRPSWLAAGPTFSLAVVVTLWRQSGWRTIVASVLIVGVSLATLLPWALRNQRETGHLIFTTLWDGPSLYDGLNPDATGDSNMSFIARERPFEHMTEYEVNRHYSRRAREYARAHPRHAVQLAAAKLIRFWKPWPNAVQFAGPWQKLIVLASFPPLLMFSLRGQWLYRRSLWLLLLTVGPILYFSLIHMLFVGSLRYRLPAEYPLSILAAAGLPGMRSRPAP